MVAKPPLGRIKRVDLRDHWEREDTDFTPWLAEEDNISLLSETIGIELEVQAQETSVGPFRADILCKNTADGSLVLIENQLERTDHTHLGQLLTYASGLDAVTVIWIAYKFTAEHRSVLDWLNRITHEGFHFIGVEIELWCIGGSQAAPKFNLVVQPNEWVKAVREASGTSGGPLSDRQRLYLDYWSSLNEYLESRGSKFRPRKPQPGTWVNWGIGRSGCALSAGFNVRDGNASVYIALMGSYAKPRFRRLSAEKVAIEEAIGVELDWQERPDNPESYIVARRDVGSVDKDGWPELHAWMLEHLTRFDDAFRPRIRDMDLADLEEDSEGRT